MTQRIKLPKEKWYVVQIMPQFHQLAQYHLTRQGFTNFFPTLRTRKTKLLYTEEPLFKGYAFIQFDPLTNTNWKSINSTRGVISLVPKHSLLPQPMPVGWVEYLLKNNPVTHDQFIESLDMIPVGTVVTLKADVLKDYFKGKQATVINSFQKKVEIAFERTNRTIVLDRTMLNI